MAMKDPVPSIEPDEYLARQRQARRVGSAMGYDVLLAGSSGGPTHDHSADVHYPTRPYSPLPCVPDTSLQGAPYRGERSGPCLWRCAGHSASILPVKFHTTKRNSGVPNFTVQDWASRTKPEHESFCRRRRRQIDRKG